MNENEEKKIYETEFVEGVSKDGEREMDFYRKLRGKIDAYLAKHPNAKFAGYLAAVPDVFYLMVRLVMDTGVPASAKIKLAGAVSYYILPIDIVPDFIPVAGWLDDLVVSVTLLNRALDEIDPAIVDKYWAGEDEVYDFIKSVLDKGDKLVGSRVWNAIKKLLSKTTDKTKKDE